MPLICPRTLAPGEKAKPQLYDEYVRIGAAADAVNPLQLFSAAEEVRAALTGVND